LALGAAFFCFRGRDEVSLVLYATGLMLDEGCESCSAASTRTLMLVARCASHSWLAEVSEGRGMAEVQTRQRGTKRRARRTSILMRVFDLAVMPGKLVCPSARRLRWIVGMLKERCADCLSCSELSMCLESKVRGGDGVYMPQDHSVRLHSIVVCLALYLGSRYARSSA
jgi:hypothetical protein